MKTLLEQHFFEQFWQNILQIATASNQIWFSAGG